MKLFVYSLVIFFLKSKLALVRGGGGPFLFFLGDAFGRSWELLNLSSVSYELGMKNGIFRSPPTVAGP